MTSEKTIYISPDINKRDFIWNKSSLIVFFWFIVAIFISNGCSSVINEKKPESALSQNAQIVRYENLNASLITLENGVRVILRKQATEDGKLWIKTAIPLFYDEKDLGAKYVNLGFVLSSF